MKIGYPCINYTLDCKADKTIRAKYYDKEKHLEVIKNNLTCLRKILEYNVENGIFFHRISSETIPLATHPISEVNWKKEFAKEIKQIGSFIEKNNIRISMHPDHFVILNSPEEKVVKKGVEELRWHAEFLDLMELDETAKIQIHIGGVYGDKETAIKRFVENYKKISEDIKKRLVIENDDYKFNVEDALKINKETGIPIIFDTLHHTCNNKGEDMIEAMQKCFLTWKEKDGDPMIDYSTQEQGERKGKHVSKIDEKNFKEFLNKTKDMKYDVILEIKDKEKSALKAVKML